MITHALSIRQPWAWYIVQGAKDIENRSWRPPARHVGTLIAVHATRGTRDDYAACLAPEGLPDGAIVGVVRLVGWREASDYDPHASAWWDAGYHGWLLADAVELAQPVPCKGRLGIWALPEAVRAALEAQL